MKKQDKNSIKSNSDSGEIIIYKGVDGTPGVEVRMQGETVWLSQKQMAELFDKDVRTINEHIKNVFNEGELEKNSVIRKFRTTASDGKTYDTNFYNLDVIISVGYRIKSLRGTQFRIWATQKLKEYIVKGFVMDDERLKENGGGNYWKELLDRIRDIRSSEKVLYRQVLDLYATSIDYDPRSKESQKFFAVVQNKLHYAANGKTAAELISERANADKPFMGLMVFGDGGIKKRDIIIAKNYLNDKEIKRLNNVVSAYFDIAELRALDEVETMMQDYINQLDKLIASMDRKVLQNAGKVSKIEAEKKAYAEYRKFQTKTLSPAEEAYLKNIKAIEKKVEKKMNLKKFKKKQHKNNTQIAY
ncbi:MAG: virulence RhuM family protein [Candidatus Moranbacteria bacterium]|jgi:hypothetical protein|nr:virulence RhuM family protein [Candidatus Moranbacteria bacterium]